MELTKTKVNQIQNVNDAGLFLEKLKSETSQVKEQLKPLKDSLSSLKQLDGLVKDKIKEIMESEMVAEIKTNNFKFKLVPNPPKVNIFDESLIPESYIRTKEIRSIDKKSVMQEWKDNEIEVAGTEIIREFRVKVDSIF